MTMPKYYRIVRTWYAFEADNEEQAAQESVYELSDDYAIDEVDSGGFLVDENGNRIPEQGLDGCDCDDCKLRRASTSSPAFDDKEDTGEYISDYIRAELEGR